MYRSNWQKPAAFVQVMAWCQTGEPVMCKFIDFARYKIKIQIQMHFYFL